MGQAAGTAAAMAAREGRDSRSISLPSLQSRLLEDGVIILDRAEAALKLGDKLGDAGPKSGIR